MSQPSPIPIQPSTITEVKTVTSFKVSVQDLQLFTSVSLRVELLNEIGTLIDIRYLVLTGPDYDGWNNNDTYIIDITAQKLGFVIKSSDSSSASVISDPTPTDPTPTDPTPTDPTPTDPSA